MEIYKILEELNENNGANYKLGVLKKYLDNELLKRVLTLTYDKVKFTYSVTMKNVNAGLSENTKTLEWALDILENEIAKRVVTGNTAILMIQTILESLSENDRIVFEKILSRDLKINCGRTQINKIFKNLITKQVYCRCDIYGDKTSKKINFNRKNNLGAFIQKKSDGTFKETSVSETVDIVSRSGEQYEMPKFQNIFKDAPEGAYIGEMTVVLDDELYAKIMPKIRKNNPDKALEIEDKYANGWKILDRSTGNGLINSLDIPEDNIVYELWDFIPFDEYAKAASKDKKNTPKINYQDRLKMLEEAVLLINNKQVQVIEYYIVPDLKGALTHVSKWMTAGFEGGVLKDFEMKFKDGTSTEQLKLKLEIDLDLRISEFLPGNVGSKNESYFSAIVIVNDEGTIRGQLGVTSFTEAERDWFFENKDSLIGRIVTAQCNDITIGSGKSTYALSHPRYIELRDDKDETDTLKRALATKKMAMLLTDDEIKGE